MIMPVKLTCEVCHNEYQQGCIRVDCNHICNTCRGIHVKSGGRWFEPSPGPYRGRVAQW